jgi:hypothetical protein
LSVRERERERREGGKRECVRRWDGGGGEGGWVGEWAA